MRKVAFVALGIAVLGCHASPVATHDTIDANQLLHDLQFLSSDDMRGRAAGTADSKKAREFVIKRFKESGIKPFGNSYEREFPFRGGKTGTNVIGWMGPGDKPSGKCLVITAHYDHIGVINGKIYNGADDNASGTCGLFAIAKVLSKEHPKHTLVFAAFDAEEIGLLGASAFLKNPPIPKADIAMNINLDMICRDKNNNLYAVGTYHNPQLKPLMDGVVKRSKVHVLYGYEKPGDKEDWTTMSDQWVFHEAGIPYIFFSVEDFENHHQYTDDYETITKDFYINSVVSILDTVQTFDKDLEKAAKK